MAAEEASVQEARLVETVTEVGIVAVEVEAVTVVVALRAVRASTTCEN
jgi:hypothetical protein